MHMCMHMCRSMLMHTCTCTCTCTCHMCMHMCMCMCMHTLASSAPGYSVSATINNTLELWGNFSHHPHRALMGTCELLLYYDLLTALAADY